MGWQAAIERTVEGLGYELVDVERSAGGLLRVTIDRVPGHSYPSGGEQVTVDDCERVTRQLQYLLEVEAVDYARLEVASPGLVRPLRKPADWQRFLGSEVEISLRNPFQGRRRWTGRLVERDSGFALEVQRDSINYFPVMASKPCRIGFFSELEHRVMPYDEVGLHYQRACLGRIYFKVPGGIQYGQYWLNVKFANSTIKVPFKILTKDEEKFLSKYYKSIEKQVKEAFKPKKK